jgi:predicted ATPase
LATAERLVLTLLENSATYHLTMWSTLGRCLKGALLLVQGDLAGLSFLRASLDWLREAGIGYWSAAYHGTLAKGMTAAGETAEARAAIDEALDQCDRSGERWCLPELLRIKGDLLRLGETAEAIEMAEDHFMKAIECARRQEALSWELRAATSLAGLWRARGKTGDAEQLLSSVYDRFTEGFETRDLRTAYALIKELKATRSHI